MRISFGMHQTNANFQVYRYHDYWVQSNVINRNWGHSNEDDLFVRCLGALTIDFLNWNSRNTIYRLQPGARIFSKKYYSIIKYLLLIYLLPLIHKGVIIKEYIPATKFIVHRVSTNRTIRTMFHLITPLCALVRWTRNSMSQTKENTKVWNTVDLYSLKLHFTFITFLYNQSDSIPRLV